MNPWPYLVLTFLGLAFVVWAAWKVLSLVEDWLRPVCSNCHGTREVAVRTREYGMDWTHFYPCPICRKTNP